LWRRRARSEIARDDLHAFFDVRPGHFGACTVVESESYSHRLEFHRRRILRPQHRACIAPTSASTAAASAAPAATTTLNPGTVLVRTPVAAASGETAVTGAPGIGAATTATTTAAIAALLPAASAASAASLR